MTPPLPGPLTRWTGRRAERRHADAVATLHDGSMPSCEEVAAVIHAYLDGELPKDAIPLVEHHLAHCERCGIETAVHEQVARSLAALRMEPDPATISRLESFAALLVS